MICATVCTTYGFGNSNILSVSSLDNDIFTHCLSWNTISTHRLSLNTISMHNLSWNTISTHRFAMLFNLVMNVSYHHMFVKSTLLVCTICCVSLVPLIVVDTHPLLHRLYQATKRKAIIKGRTIGNKRKRKSTESSGGEENEAESSQDVLSPSELAVLSGGNSLETLSILPETKNLVDGLSRFFTPTNKRLSRVSLSAIQPPLINLSSKKVIAEANNKNKLKAKPADSAPVKSRSKTSQSQSQQAATRLIKRSKLMHASRGRQKSQGPPLIGQLRGLFDGLSKFFNATGERKRTLPVYNPSKQKKHSPEHVSDSANSYSLSPSDHCSWDCPTLSLCDKTRAGLSVCISDNNSSSRCGPPSALSSACHDLSWWDDMKHLMQMTLEDFHHYGAHPTDARNRCWAARGPRRTWFSCGRGHGRGGSGRIFRGKLSSPSFRIILNSTPLCGCKRV